MTHFLSLYFHFSRFAVRLGILNYEASSGFISRFFSRHNVKSFIASGDAEECPDVESIIQPWWDEVLRPALLQYRPQDVFNCDETSFFYQMMPWRTYAFRGEKVWGIKPSKKHVILMLTANMDGTEKLPCVIIGTTKRLMCLRQYNMETSEMPCWYYHNDKAWMTGFLFNEIMCCINARMQAQDRKILMVMDNMSTHHVGETYSNIELLFLPPNTTPITQPMDQGIIHSVKCRYRRFLANMYLVKAENCEDPVKLIQSLDIKRAVDIITRCWSEVSPGLIANCFRHARFVKLDSADAAVPLRLMSQVEDPDMVLPRNVWDSIQVNLGFSLEFEEYAEGDCVADDEGNIMEQLAAPVIPDLHSFLATIAHQRVFLQKNNMPKAQELLVSLEKELIQGKSRALKQSRLDRFFSVRTLPARVRDSTPPVIDLCGEDEPVVEAEDASSGFGSVCASSQSSISTFFWTLSTPSASQRSSCVHESSEPVSPVCSEGLSSQEEIFNVLQMSPLSPLPARTSAARETPGSSSSTTSCHWKLAAVAEQAEADQMMDYFFDSGDSD